MTQQTQRPRRRSYAFVWTLVLLLFLCELTLAAGATLWYKSDAILPGVAAMGIDLGGMTPDAAKLALLKAWQAKTVTVHAGSNAWTLPITQLGYQIDADTMVQQARSQGRTPASVIDLLRTQTPAAIETLWKLEPGVAVTALRPLVAPLEVPARDATLKITGTRVESTPSAVGQAVDLASGLTRLEQHPERVLSDGWTDLSVVPLQPQVVELRAAAEQAQQLLAGAPISIRLYDPVKDEKLAWQITPADIGGVLALETDPQNPAASAWVVDETRLKELLQKESQTLGVGRYVNPQETLPIVKKAIMGPRDEIKLRVYHDAREHTVKFGETLSSIADDYGIPYPWIQQVNTGSGDNLRAGQKIVIPSQDEMIPLPPVENKRIVVSIKDQKMQAFEDGKLKWDWPISTGIPSSPTSPGIFQVQGRDPNAYA
ncbi:MAG: LysM peptidoglycan-binding domain-containing protein, partial [Anaerolineae bacterium]|nr:LysM peptidoglycan-binding domain-containing protein [Anaerolineae bacterium]